jgi:hypothetical protein
VKSKTNKRFTVVLFLVGFFEPKDIKVLAKICLGLLNVTAYESTDKREQSRLDDLKAAGHHEKSLPLFA